MSTSAAPARGARTTGRTIWAILAGFLTVVVLSILCDLVMYATGLFVQGGRLSDSQAVISTVYRTVFTVLGGYVAARLAPNRPMRHALILGVVGTIAGLIGVAATWNLNLGPRWYPIALMVLAVPSCWLGGRLFARR